MPMPRGFNYMMSCISSDLKELFHRDDALLALSVHALSIRFDRAPTGDRHYGEMFDRWNRRWAQMKECPALRVAVADTLDLIIQRANNAARR